MPNISFTDREMQRAWKDNLKASYHENRNNAHRLLLFYAIECGLKAILMKRQSINCTNNCRDIINAQHDINKLLDKLKAGQNLKLPNQFNMTPIRDRGTIQERRLDPSKINQMWRYGGKIESGNRNNNLDNLTDEELEQRLIIISDWIKKELR